MKKPRFLETSVQTVGPRKIAELMDTPINKLKYEREVCRVIGIGDPFNLPGQHFASLLERLVEGSYEVLIHAQLNPDYKSFKVMTFRLSAVNKPH